MTAAGSDILQNANDVVVSELDRRGKIAVAKIFKDGVATGNPGNNYYQYITPAYIGFLSKTERPLAVGQVGLELKKFVNTLELPSENEFYFTLGYSKTINGV